MHISKTPLFAATLLAGLTVNAATYLLIDTTSSFTDKAESWMVLDNNDTPSSYSLPIVYDPAYEGEKTAKPTYKFIATGTPATTLPTANDNVYLSSYMYVDADGVSTEKKETSSFVRQSTSWNNVVHRGFQTLTLGTGFSSDTDFVLQMSSYQLGYATGIIKKHSAVNQKYFSVEIENNAKVEACDFTLGGANERNEDGTINKDNFIDNFAVGGQLWLREDNGKSRQVNLYAKNITAGELVISDGVNLTIFLTQAMFEQGNTVLLVDEKLKKGESNNISLDFAEVDWDLVEAGTYDLITAGTLDGFNKDDVTLDFTEKNSTGLRDGLESNLLWNGNTLQLVITGNVPEPSTVALIFGAIAVAFVAIRRKK